MRVDLFDENLKWKSEKETATRMFCEFNGENDCEIRPYKSWMLGGHAYCVEQCVCYECIIICASSVQI